MVLRRRALVSSAFAGLLVAVLPRAQEATPPAPAAVVDASRAALRSALQAEFEAQGLVGLAVAVVRDGRVVDELHFGLADRDKTIPVDARTMFRWASISKPLTAIAAMQLVDAGKLDLDEDVRKWVPEFPEKPWRITSRQLLTHQGGIVHYTNGKVVRTQRQYDVEHPFNDVVLALDMFKESPLVAEPGTKHSYTTHGYMLLGAVVERAGEQRFAEQIRQRIAEPLGMTTLQPDYQWVDIPHRAVGYVRVGARVLPSTDTDVSWKLAGGGFVSTIGDLGRFAAGLVGDAWLSPAVREELWTRQTTAGGSVTGYGLGFGVSSVSGKRRVAHSGAQEKTRTLLHAFPDEGLAVVLMTNSEWAKLDACATAAWAVLRTPSEPSKSTLDVVEPRR